MGEKRGKNIFVNLIEPHLPFSKMQIDVFRYHILPFIENPIELGMLAQVNQEWNKVLRKNIIYSEFLRHWKTNKTLADACKNGHLQIAKYHHNRVGSRLNELMFKIACYEGHLTIVIWLVSIGVSIHLDNEYGFKCVCRRGHLDLAQWFHSLEINIHVNLNYAFVCPQVKEHPKIVEWLHTVKLFKE